MSRFQGTGAIEASAGLDDGCYLAQGSDWLRYCTAEAAPSDLADWFLAAPRDFLSFTVGGDTPATWFQSATPGIAVTVALAVTE